MNFLNVASDLTITSNDREGTDILELTILRKSCIRLLIFMEMLFLIRGAEGGQVEFFMFLGMIITHLNFNKESLQVTV